VVACLTSLLFISHAARADETPLPGYPLITEAAADATAVVIYGINFGIAQTPEVKLGSFPALTVTFNDTGRIIGNSARHEEAGS
jgi:hypothetical protein